MAPSTAVKLAPAPPPVPGLNVIPVARELFPMFTMFDGQSIGAEENIPARRTAAGDRADLRIKAIEIKDGRGRIRKGHIRIIAEGPAGVSHGSDPGFEGTRRNRGRPRVGVREREGQLA